MRTVTQYIFAFSFSKTDETVQFKSRKGLNVKDICSVLSERFVNDKIIEMTENEFVFYHQSRRLGYHRRGKGLCVGEFQEELNTTLRRSRRTRKRTHFDEFMYYGD